MPEVAAVQGLWRLRLVVKNGVDAGKSVTVEGDAVAVGKLPDCDLVLTDSTVSRRHLRIFRSQEGTWRVVDLGSTNGTWVGGARVMDAPVEAGSILRAGNVEIVFMPEREALEIPPWPEERYGNLIGRSLPMRQLFGLIHRVAPTDATVLIQGETGTGKGAVARAIQQASDRAKAPYVVVDCGAVQRQLIESELFGHEKGAFSGAYVRRQGAFELANEGTVFLDELGELGLELQPKLLRVLDAREVRRIGGDAPIALDLRVLAASRRELAREVGRGAFREDLYFRLSVVTLLIPPLRDRPEDIPLLVESFLREICAARSVAPPKLDSSTLDRLTAHDWPGNVRELRNVIERAVLLSQVQAGRTLEIRDLGSGKAKAGPSIPSAASAFDPGASFSEAKERWMNEREKAYVTWLLARHGNNVSQAAREAQLDRKYLHKLIKKHALE